jgi:Sulfotransferase domain
MADEPLFVISLPKAGTYLTAELLKALGYRFTGWHVGEVGCTDYSRSDLLEARRNPAKYTRSGSPETFLSQIRPGEFAVGHLPFTKEMVQATAGFKRIYLTRDLRTALISYMRFLEDTGRMGAASSPWFGLADRRLRVAVFLQHTAPQILEQLYERMVGWSRIERTHLIRFEDLISDVPRATRTVEALAGFLGVNRGDAPSILEASLAATTLTKSDGLTRLDDYWSDEAEKWFHQSGTAALEARLAAPNQPPAEQIGGGKEIWTRAA